MTVPALVAGSVHVVNDPAPVVASLVERLSTVTQHLVNIDWSEEWRWKTPEHVWVHDYRALYAQR